MLAVPLLQFMPCGDMELNSLIYQYSYGKARERKSAFVDMCNCAGCGILCNGTIAHACHPWCLVRRMYAYRPCRLCMWRSYVRVTTLQVLLHMLSGRMPGLSNVLETGGMRVKNCINDTRVCHRWGNQAGERGVMYVANVCNSRCMLLVKRFCK